MKFAALIVGMALTPVLGHATPVFHDGFESSLSAWQHMGDVSIQNGNLGVKATDGSQYALLTTLCDRQVANCETTSRELPYSGVNAVAADHALSAFGMSMQDAYGLVSTQHPDRTVPRGEGSALYTSIYLNAGDTLSFDHHFITTEFALNGDQAYFTLFNPLNGFRLFDFLNPLEGSGDASTFDLCNRQVFDNPGVCGDFMNNWSDGWRSKSYTATESAMYVFGFGLWETLEGTVPSALLIDNFAVSHAIPAPGTLGLVMAAGLVALARRRRA